MNVICIYLEQYMIYMVKPMRAVYGYLVGMLRAVCGYLVRLVRAVYGIFD